MRKCAASSSSGFDGRQAFGHGRNFVRAVRLEPAQAQLPVPWHCRHPAPCAQPSHFAVERRVEARLFLRADQGKHRAPRHGNVGVAGELQHAQGVQGFFVAPCVAGDHGDAQNLHIGRLQQRQHGHLVRAAGAGAVLIDEHQAFLRGQKRGASPQAAAIANAFLIDRYCGTARQLAPGGNQPRPAVAQIHLFPWIASIALFPVLSPAKASAA